MKINLIITLLVAFSATSCIKDLICIDGNGILETQPRETSDFTQLENSTIADVVYKKADSPGITITAESNLLGHFVTETVNGNLKIRTDPSNACFNYIERPLITVTSPVLNKVILSGSGEIITDVMSGNSVIIKLSGSGDFFTEVISCSDLSLILSGSGDININEAECLRTDFNLSGSGDINIKGSSDDATYRISGSGNINSGEFLVLTASETISGSGNIFTHVVTSLAATLSGSGNIYLKGDPMINQSISGSGKIIRY